MHYSLHDFLKIPSTLTLKNLKNPKSSEVLKKLNYDFGMANLLVSSQARCEVCNLEFGDQYFAFKTELIK